MLDATKPEQPSLMAIELFRKHLELKDHRRGKSGVQPGDAVFRDRITKAFTEARELAGITGENSPTFHEIRSLSKRTYMQQGNVDTKVLLGHTTEKASNIYADPRGAEPLRVRVS